MVARARSDRALHPKGEVWRASVHPAPAGRRLIDGEGQAVVRLSRAVGLPDWLPDVHGVAIRLLGTESVDILLAGSDRRASWALVPALRPGGTYSTLAHYEFDGKRVRFMAEVDDGTVSLHYEAHGVLTPVAEIVLDRRTDEVIRFLPEATGSRLRPVGPLNALRPSSYRASRTFGPPEQGRSAGQG